MVLLIVKYCGIFITEKGEFNHNIVDFFNNKFIDLIVDLHRILNFLILLT